MANTSFTQTDLANVETALKTHIGDGSKSIKVSIDYENGGSTQFEDLESLKKFHKYLYDFLNKNSDLDVDGTNKANAYRPIHVNPYYRTGNSWFLEVIKTPHGTLSTL